MQDIQGIKKAEKPCLRWTSFFKYDNTWKYSTLVLAFLLEMYANQVFFWMSSYSLLGGEDIFYSNLSGENSALHKFQTKNLQCCRLLPLISFTIYLVPVCLRAAFGILKWNDLRLKCGYMKHQGSVRHIITQIKCYVLCDTRMIQQSLLPLLEPFLFFLCARLR